MTTRRGKTLPSDHTPDRPRTEGGRDFYHDAGNTLGGLTATEDTRWDARMAVTFVNKHPELFDADYARTDVIGVIFFALGLAEPPSAVGLASEELTGEA